MERNIGYAGAVSARPTADQPMTEMENLGVSMAGTASRLQGLVDRLNGRVQNFISEPRPITAGPAEKVSEPPPGTLGALRHFHQRIADECDRLESVATTIAGIL